MIFAKRQEDLQKFGEDGVGHSLTVYAAIEAAFEAGGEEWANRVAIATTNKFLSDLERNVQYRGLVCGCGMALMPITN